MRRYIIIRGKCHEEKHEDEHVQVEGRVTTPSGKEHNVKFDLPYAQAANAAMSAKGFTEYVKKHGYHFTDALAEHVSSLMENADGTSHSWGVAQVTKYIESLGLVLPDTVTDGDVAYQANQFYADLYPDVLKDEASCIKAAHRIAHDPDGYEGMIFCRWTSDVIGKAIHIDWEKFI